MLRWAPARSGNTASWALTPSICWSGPWCSRGSAPAPTTAFSRLRARWPILQEPKPSNLGILRRQSSIGRWTVLSGHEELRLARGQRIMGTSYLYSLAYKDIPTGCADFDTRKNSNLLPSSGLREILQTFTGMSRLSGRLEVTKVTSAGKIFLDSRSEEHTSELQSRQ